MLGGDEQSWAGVGDWVLISTVPMDEVDAEVEAADETLHSSFS